jgi:hypothetical protein
LENGNETLQPLYRRIIHDVAAGHFTSLETFADEVISKLKPQILAEIQKDRSLPVIGAKPYCFNIQFAGYCEGTPIMTTRQLDMWENKWCVTSLESSQPARPGDRSFVGSHEVLKRIVNVEDKEFIDFKTVGFSKFARHQGGTRKEFIDGAKRYIEACMTPAARRIDKNICEGIGGDIRSAVLSENGDLQLCVIGPASERENN